MSDIKIFVSCHKPYPVPENPLLLPIQVGSTLAQERIAGFFQDDEGDNISDKNHSYCELTAQYWAWKNVQANYYGFFHYRRYLYPDLNEKRPYKIERMPTSKLLQKLRFINIAQIVEEYDLIAPIGENMFVPVRKHYEISQFHHKKDLDLVENIVQEIYPNYVKAMKTYLSQYICYFGNIFIMEKGLFDRYCTWLFSILNEFDRRATLCRYDPAEMRVDGYLAERLFGIFYTQCRMDGVRWLELPRVDFIDDGNTRRKRKFLAVILPPGTKRRAIVKQWSCVRAHFDKAGNIDGRG